MYMHSPSSSRLSALGNGVLAEGFEREKVQTCFLKVVLPVLLRLIQRQSWSNFANEHCSFEFYIASRPEM